MTVNQTYINCKQTDKGDATMKSIPFKREARYVVFKLKDIHANLSAEQIAALQLAGETIAAGRAIAGKPPFNAVVVEQDWPEFEMVWNAIETRERLISSTIDAVRTP